MLSSLVFQHDGIFGRTGQVVTFVIGLLALSSGPILWMSFVSVRLSRFG